MVPPCGGMGFYLEKRLSRSFLRFVDTYSAGAGSTLRSLTRAF
jgi:hypothetical protein